MLRLVITSGPENGRSLDSHDLTEIEIGRQARHLRLTDGRVSRVHCCLDKNDAGEWFIVDRNSKHGTLHNGRLVTGRGRIADGDMVTLGHTVIRCFISKPVAVAKDPRMRDHNGSTQNSKQPARANNTPSPTRANASPPKAQPQVQKTVQKSAPKQAPRPTVTRQTPPEPARPAKPNPQPVVERVEPVVTPVSSASKNGEEAADCWMDAIMSEMQAFDENEEGLDNDDHR